MTIYPSAARVARFAVTLRGGLRRVAIAASALTLAACATLPTNAPTMKQVERDASASKDGLRYQIVDIDAQAATRPPAGNAMDMLQLEALSALGSAGRTDLIRKGDTLTVRIFEVGISLFGTAPQSSNNASQNLATADTPVANAQSFTLQVREDGSIELPYVGVLQAAGRYPETLAQAIKTRLRPLSQSPEAMVTIADTLENTVYVLGAATKPGRYRLTSARERLLDVVALAGGPKIEQDDAELRVVRAEKSATIALNALEPEDLANITVMPADRIEIRKSRKTYTVFGATERVSQVPFDAQKLSLAEALARVGGPSDARANPRGVFVFRFERGANGEPPRPTIYRLNMMNAESYFLAQLFEMQDKDVLLFANADANLPGKFIAMINQLLSPAITARVLTDTRR